MKKPKPPKAIEEFELARKAWPGIKRGYETELKCLKKHKDWKAVIKLLKPAITDQIRRRKVATQENRFVPPWKNFKTWLNNRCWEESEGITESQEERESREKSRYERKKQKDRDDQQGYLENKTTAALLDLKADKKALVARWLIDEILSKRKDNE